MPHSMYMPISLGHACCPLKFHACSPTLQVFYTKGSPQLWKATFKAGKLLNASNAAAQDLDPGSRTVVNSAEYFGRRLYVTASGTYEPLVRGAVANNLPVTALDVSPAAHVTAACATAPAQPHQTLVTVQFRDSISAEQGQHLEVLCTHCC
jgi:hypothetical protein